MNEIKIPIVQSLAVPDIDIIDEFFFDNVVVDDDVVDDVGDEIIVEGDVDEGDDRKLQSNVQNRK